MYFHRQELQHSVTPDKPDAVYARTLQEGVFTYLPEPPAGVPMPPPTKPDVRFYGTTELPNTVEKLAGRVQDALHKE